MYEIMKYNISGTSIAEAIVLTLIVTLWLFGMYNLYDSSQKLANTTQNRIQAIGIAREWIEAVTNIRDTNWKTFSANNQNCWNTFNYNWTCITANVDISSWSYILYQDNFSRWNMAAYPASNSGAINYSSGGYRTNFWIKLDANGLYTQSGGTTLSGTVFTREIKISYPSDAGTPPEKMDVKSIVYWSDSSKTGLQKIELETQLTNWRK